MPIGIYPRKSATERFWAKVLKTATCWLWQAHIMTNGYGLFSPTHERPVLAHRFAYQEMKGSIPDGLQLDHLCRNRACVNPAHLEAVSARVNVLRGEGRCAVNAAKTHCPHGHPYDLFNTYVKPNQQRVCLACRATDPKYHMSKQQREMLKLARV